MAARQNSARNRHGTSGRGIPVVVIGSRIRSLDTPFADRRCQQGATARLITSNSPVVLHAITRKAFSGDTFAGYPEPKVAIWGLLLPKSALKRRFPSPKSANWP